MAKKQKKENNDRIHDVGQLCVCMVALGLACGGSDGVVVKLIVSAVMLFFAIRPVCDLIKRGK